MSKPKAPKSRQIQIVTSDTLGDQPIRYGAALHATAVSGANIFRDMREAVTNTVGGKMRSYEQLVDATMERALDSLEQRALAAGYDGVIGLRVSHPPITDGAIEIVVVGTGVWFVAPTQASSTATR